MIRAQGILEVSIRTVCIAMASAALCACSQTAQPPTGTTLNAPSQTDMVEVVISASRGQADATHRMGGAPAEH